MTVQNHFARTSVSTMTKPIFTQDFILLDSNHVLQTLHDEVVWDERAGNRKESFQSLDLAKTYSYGKADSINRRTYHPSEMHGLVKMFLVQLNDYCGTDYNICVLNYYADQHNSLGWHADDSPEQDPNHPIAVISFGATRYIFTKENGYKGIIPNEDRYLLTPGSLFIMPPGFQDTHQHKIPRHDTKCGPRVSMTYRKLDR